MRGTAAALVVAASAVILAQGPATFRAGVDLVALSVAVTQDGRPYAGELSAADFTVLENGRPQTLVLFERPANTALTVSMLLDTSASMSPDLRLIQDAAIRFVDGLRPGDMAEIIDFDRDARVVQPFTSDRDMLRRAIRSTTGDGTTALYDAVRLGLRELEAARQQTNVAPRRAAMVVLSDGNVTSGNLDFEALVEIVRRSSIVIYTIVLERPTGVTVGPGARPGSADSSSIFNILSSGPNAERALRRLADESGGRFLNGRDAESLVRLYDAVADELNSVYLLGYHSSNPPRAERRRIEVRLRPRGLEAQTRAGYYAGR